jgi:hypothetical protein
MLGQHRVLGKHRDILLQEHSMSFGGPFGGGGLFGGMGQQGSYGAYPGCGCSSFIIIIAGLLLAFGGCMRMVGF